MENVGASCSSDPATSHSPSYQSPWLQRTLSDLDSKMKAMMTLLEDDGNLSTHRDDSYRKRISELKQMLEGFNTSYRSLAEKYDQLRSQSEHMAHSGKVQHTSNNRKSTAESLDNHKLEGCNFQPDSAAEDPDDECDGVDRGFEYLSKLADELISIEAHKQKFELRDNQTDKEITNFLENGQATLPELSFQVTKLLEENLRQQAELLRRNREKRKAIGELRSQLEDLKPEKRISQSLLRCTKTDVKRNRLKKLFSGGCSSFDMP